MPDRRVVTAEAAIAGIESGMTIMVGGFGVAGVPFALLEAIRLKGLGDFTVISNNAGFGGRDLTSWIEAGMVRRVICSYPRTSPACIAQWKAGQLEIEVVPQGTLTERMRCAGAGLGGVFSPVSAGTLLAEGKEQRTMDGVDYVLELPLRADVALLHAYRADPNGNLVYRMTARNFSPVMATAARLVVVEVAEMVPLGGLDPEHVVTPGIFVDRLLPIGESGGGTAP